jgi:hypothetical protein
MSILNKRARVTIERIAIAKDLLPISNWKYDVVALTKDQVEFIGCSMFDYVYEPLITDRFVVKINDKLTGGREVIYRKEGNNPRLFHKRYLFIYDTYKNFSYENDKKRGDYLDSLNLDKKRIGRMEYWSTIIARYNLQFFSPNKHKGTLE